MSQRKCRLLKRIDQHEGPTKTPMIAPPRTVYQLSDKVQAVACGGLAAIQEVVRASQLRQHIGRQLSVFKVHAPYDEADHVLNIAFNLLTGGTCLDHLEHRRNDEAYLNALDAHRIPDPTTAGDFCRRLDFPEQLQLMSAINAARLEVWKRQPREFFEQATIDADGSMVETYGEKKEGIGIDHKGQWGYQVLAVTLAETKELLYLHNRSGNRPSHEGSVFYFDQAIQLCRQAGFRKIRLRGDTDFALTANFDRWHADGIEFVFGFDCTPKLEALAETLENTAWTKLVRPAKEIAGAPRAKRENFKEAIVIENEYDNFTLIEEHYAEFTYQPTKCGAVYRVVAVRKLIRVTKGQRHLRDDHRYFFYITNATKQLLPARKVIEQANKRCDQENTIAQLKACHALAAPLHDLASNGAYMLMASLAWTLKVWSGLMIQVEGTKNEKAERRAARQRVSKMEFHTFLNACIMVPAQIIRTSRQLIYRLLTYRPTLDDLLLIHHQARQPLST